MGKLDTETDLRLEMHADTSNRDQGMKHWGTSGTNNAIQSGTGGLWWSEAGTATAHYSRVMPVVVPAELRIHDFQSWKPGLLLKILPLPVHQVNRMTNSRWRQGVPR